MQTAAVNFRFVTYIHIYHLAVHEHLRVAIFIISPFIVISAALMYSRVYSGPL